MRLQDAPPPGWYPDPEGYSRLRWWEGADWADHYRAPPTPSEFDLRGQTYGASAQPDDAVAYDRYVPAGGMSRQDSQAVIEQVRLAARAEAERAAEMFGQQARAVTRNITPLISEYTNKVIKWFRILSIIAIVLIVGWLAFQLFAQVSMFQWIGDRIDNLTNNGSLVQLRSSG